MSRVGPDAMGKSKSRETSTLWRLQVAASLAKEIGMVWYGMCGRWTQENWFCSQLGDINELFHFSVLQMGIM